METGHPVCGHCQAHGKGEGISAATSRRGQSGESRASFTLPGSSSISLATSELPKPLLCAQEPAVSVGGTWLSPLPEETGVKLSTQLAAGQGGSSELGLSRSEQAVNVTSSCAAGSDVPGCWQGARRTLCSSILGAA